MGLFRTSWFQPIRALWIPTKPPTQIATAGIAIVTVTTIGATPLPDQVVTAGVAIVNVTTIGVSATGGGTTQTVSTGVATVTLLVLRPARVAQGAACHRISNCQPSDVSYVVGSASSATAGSNCRLVNVCNSDDYDYVIE